jgi:hypothetical protein
MLAATVVGVRVLSYFSTTCNFFLVQYMFQHRKHDGCVVQVSARTLETERTALTLCVVDL